MAMTNKLILVGAAALAVLVGGCGGGGGGGGSGDSISITDSSSSSGATSSSSGTTSSSSSSGTTTTASNVVAISVDRDLAGVSNVNLPYVSVTVCEPGSTKCQTIDHVLLDTGSTGLRVLYSQLDTSLNLPRQTAANGTDMAECAAFIFGYTYGTVRKADVRLGGLTASSLPIQVIADPVLNVIAGVSNVPGSCSSRGGSEMKTLSALGAKGILGVGWYKEDCGSTCASRAVSGVYYGCTNGYLCSPVAASLDRQVSNPVALMARDNNGVLLEMDAVSAAGAASVSGKLYLGIGTQTNNALGSAVVYDLNASGNLKTEYKGTTFSAFVDSGSNGLFFPDDTIATCASDTNAPGFFCPSSPIDLTATIVGATNGKRGTVNFSIANAHNLVTDNPGFIAFNNIGAPMDATTGFDWGLPFFYGRRVFVAVEDYDTPAGKGPYIAY